MNDVITMGLLLDYYGQFLTEKQQKAMELHLNEDWSLSEIAEYLGISRQGAYDYIKKGKALLNEFEEKLHLVKNSFEIKDRIGNLTKLCEKLRNNMDDEGCKSLCNEIIEGLKALMNLV